MAINSILVSCDAIDPNRRNKDSPGDTQLTDPGRARYFNSCAELNAQLDSQWNRKDQVVSYDSETSPAPTAASYSINSNGKTADQEDGVQEADTFLVHDFFLIQQRDTDLVILDRQSQNQLGTLSLNGNTASKIFLYKNELVIASQTTESTSVGGRQVHTLVESYSLTQNKLPTLSKKSKINGYLIEARIINNRLVILTDAYLNKHYEEGSSDFKKVPCNQIIARLTTDAQTPINPPVMSLLNIFSVDLSSPTLDSKSVAYFGKYVVLYSTKSKLVLANPDSSYNGFGTQLSIVSLNPSDGSLALYASGLIEGTIKNRWALKLSKDEKYLFAATHNWKNRENTLSSFTFEDEKIITKSKFTGFATGEDIRAIRYENDMAYIVTFKQTDPLFAFEISNPENITLKSEVKIPGFSTMLYPLSQNRLLGVGFDAEDSGDFQGIKTSLFAQDSNSVQSTLDSVVHGKRGSSSEASFNQHAFYYDQLTSTFGLPIKVYGDSTKQQENDFGEFLSSGSMFYSFKNDKLELIREESMQDLIPSGCQSLHTSSKLKFWHIQSTLNLDVQRIVNIDHQVVLVSPFGIRILNKDLSQEIKTIRFANADGYCDNLELRNNPYYNYYQ